MSLTIENNILMKNGKPFFYLADTCWSAFTNIKDNDWDYYLDYRKSQGFNTLQINILPQWDASATDLCYEPFEVIDGKYNYKKLNLSYFDFSSCSFGNLLDKGFFKFCDSILGSYCRSKDSSRYAQRTIYSSTKITIFLF